MVPGRSLSRRDLFDGSAKVHGPGASALRIAPGNTIERPIEVR